MDARPSNIGIEESYCATTLVERGLQYFHQGRSSEGFTLLMLARERLLPDQTQIAIAIDALVQSHRLCCQAQQNLFLASKHFAEADAEQSAGITALEKLLPSPVAEKNKASPLLYKWTETLPSEQVAQESPANDAPLFRLFITCFGCFEVRRLDKPIVLCSNRNGQAILRYLVAQTGYRASADRLMNLFWPEDESEVAHRKLQVAMSLLRKSLNGENNSKPEGGYITCKNGVYQLNAEVAIYTDVNEFLSCYKRGIQDKENGIALFEQACRLYVGPFLVEDIYSDWSLIQREQLAQMYFTMCSALVEHFLRTGRYADAITWATATLKENRCDEAAYRQLMIAYAANGQRGEALRQYHRCEQVLSEELELSPMPETIELFQSILLQEFSPAHQAFIEQS